MEYRLQISGRFNTLEDREFVFPIGTSLVTGSNGSGKSSLLHILTWILFDYALGDRGKQGSRSDGLYNLQLTNHIFDVKAGKSQKEGLYFKGKYNDSELKGERAENYQKFLGWLDIKPGQAFSTILERIQFDPASPSIFTFTQKALIEGVTSALSERTRQYQTCYDRLILKRKQIKDELDRAKERSQDLSGSEFVSTEQLEEEIKLEHAKINGRPEPFKLPYFEKRLSDLQIELKSDEINYKTFIQQIDEQRQKLQNQLVHTEFDETQVKRERDKILAKLATLGDEIKKLEANVLKPKPCENCGIFLLEGDDKYIVANIVAINSTKELIENKKVEQAQAKGIKDNLDRFLALAEIKRQLARLEVNLIEKTAEYKKSLAEREKKIASIEKEIADCQAAEPFWKRVAELEQRLVIIKDNNERLEKLKAQAEIVAELEQKFRLYDFHKNAGVRDLLFSHFVDQCSRFSEEVNEVLYACDLGKIEFIPEFKDSNIERIRLRHFEKGEWRPYDQREDSLKKILDWAAWIANIKLNPQKVDMLKLMLVDDFGHVFNTRLERFLGYMRKQPVVVLFAWAFRDCEKYLKPVQTIILGE